MVSEAIQWSAQMQETAFKLYSSERDYKQTGMYSILQNESVFKQNISAQRTGWLASSALSGRCRYLILISADWMETTPPPTSSSNKTTRLVCCCFDFFSQWGGRGGVEIGGGRKKRGKGGVRIEKNITHGLGLGGFIQDSSLMYASEHECVCVCGRGITSVDRHADQRAVWLFF